MPGIVKIEFEDGSIQDVLYKGEGHKDKVMNLIKSSVTLFEKKGRKIKDIGFVEIAADSRYVCRSCGSGIVLDVRQVLLGAQESQVLFTILPPDADLAKRFAFYRKLAKLSLQDLANKTSVTEDALRKIEAGERDPSIKTVLDVSGALGIAPSALMPQVAGATGNTFQWPEITISELEGLKKEMGLADPEPKLAPEPPQEKKTVKPEKGANNRKVTDDKLAKAKSELEKLFERTNAIFDGPVETLDDIKEAVPFA